MSNVAYKRGQVEWALWRALTLHRNGSDDPPQVFKTRIKQLLDLDRICALPSLRKRMSEPALIFFAIDVL